MDQSDLPECSRNPNVFMETTSKNDKESSLSTEIHTCDLNINKDAESTNLGTPKPFSLRSSISQYYNENMLQAGINISTAPVSFILCNNSSVITTQPRISTNLPMSLISINNQKQPQSLFLQALSKLNGSSISVAVLNLNNRTNAHEISLATSQIINNANQMKSLELSPPDSLCSAPPSYSFVLRQIAFRRRPRIVGTFIPSPSFIQQTPPPHYAASFDVYLDNIPPLPPPRVYHFGFASMPVVCPNCGYTGMSVVTSKITICTHVCAIILCILCCWICAPLPYVLRSCKDVSHYCRNCRNFLGMYCPTNPECG